MNAFKHDVVKVQAQKRESYGSKFSRKLREQGLITARIDRCPKNEYIIVEEKFFTNALAKRRLIAHVFDIEIDGHVERVVLKDYQKDPVSGKMVNLDFVKIHKDQYIKLRVPLFYINKSKSLAIKRGAFLNVSKFFVDLQYLGDNIAPYFIMDLDGSDVLHEYKVENLDLPKHTKVLKKNEVFANFRGKRGQKLDIASMDAAPAAPAAKTAAKPAAKK
jgi:large subunit ribosomal protein L25